MKKLLFLLLSIFTVFGIAACDGTVTDGTETTVEINEQLEMPINLAIDEENQMLTWDAVTDAESYAVYVDGVMVEEVTETSFDFSSLEGSRLIFSVKALAPNGMFDSNISNSLAFIADRETAISELKATMTTYNMNVSDEDAFATELVNKGMLSSDLESMMTDVQSLQTVNPDDFSDMFDAIDGVMESMDLSMIEALVSSLIKVELPNQLQSQITYYESMNDTYGYYSEDIVMLNNLLDFITENDEEAIRSVMVVIEYIMDVEASIDSEMVTGMETLMNSTSPSDMNLTLFVTLKNDLINQFKNNLPSLDDVIILNTTVLTLANVMAEEAMDISIISIPEQSQMSLYSIELMLNFFLEIDEDYISAIIDISESESMANGQAFLEENIRILDAYLESNETLIDQMNSIYTDEEKQDMMSEYLVMTMMTSLMNVGLEEEDLETTVRTIVENNFDFNNVLILQNMADDAFNDLLDDIIESDYLILDYIFTLQEISDTSYNAIVDNDDHYNEDTMSWDMDFRFDIAVEPGTYYVYARGLSDYETGALEINIELNGGEIVNQVENLAPGQVFTYEVVVTQPSLLTAYTVSDLDTYGYLISAEDYVDPATLPDEDEVVIDLLSEMVSLFNPILQNMTVTEYDAFLELGFSAIWTQYTLDQMMTEFPESMPSEELLNIIEAAIMDTSENQLNLMKSMMNVVADNTYLAEISTLMDSTSENVDYGLAILAANAYIQFYNNAETDLDAVLDKFVETISNETVKTETEMTQAEIDLISSVLDVFASELYTRADVIKDFDYESLTQAQMDQVMAFMQYIEDPTAQTTE